MVILTLFLVVHFLPFIHRTSSHEYYAIPTFKIYTHYIIAVTSRSIPIEIPFMTAFLYQEIMFFFLNDCIPILGNNGFFKHFALQKKCHLTTVNPTFTRIMSMKPRTNTVSFIVGRISNNTLMEMPSFLPLIKYNSLQSLSVGPVPPAPSVPRSPAIHEAMTHA